MCTTPSTAQAGANAGISCCYGGEGGLDLQLWDLNRAHETETTVFPIHRFSACVDADYEIKESIKDIQQTVQWTLYEHFYYKQGLNANAIDDVIMRI